jgi:hypothetical protein
MYMDGVHSELGDLILFRRRADFCLDNASQGGSREPRRHDEGRKVGVNQWWWRAISEELQLVRGREFGKRRKAFY